MSKAPPWGEDTETGRRGDTERGQGKSDQLSVNSYQSTREAQRGSEQSSVTVRSGDDAAGQKGNLTHDLDLNHNLVLSGKAPPGTHTASGGEDTETPRSPAGMAENQGAPPPEHDAAWYSPSARAARITQSMIEHRLRKRRVEM